PVYSQNYKMMELASADSAASTPVEPGEIDLQTTLTVMYELK
ncbi:SIMPL domain-containing protein, partial [Salmonella enterica subsp. enterica serovar Typhi]|nr:SIMPL domain-containing protein [Salmonella enterica subsp. enterica serovar Typhi]